MSTRSPFVGSRPFDTADEAIFHGRAREAAALAKLWRDHRVTILHGPAGVGKTSLLRAGVLPELDASTGSRVLPIGRLAFLADFPLAALPDINPFTFALLASWYPEDPPTRIAGSSIRGLVRKNAGVDRHGDALPVLAAIDQTDLLFLGGHEERDDHRRRFADELVEATTARHDLHLLIAVRTENLDELQALLMRSGMPVRHLTRFPLRAFSLSAARQVVSGPLGDTGHPLAASADRLVDELGAGDTAIDPALLQIVCSRLWEELPRDGGDDADRLPRAVDRVLGDHCLRSLAAVATAYGEWPSALATWFRQVFGRKPDADGVPEGRRLTRDLPNAVVRALEDVRLLVADRHAGRRRYRLPQARLRPVVRRLDAEAAASVRHERPRLEAAEAAFAAGDLDLARRLATAVAREAGAGRPVRGAAECLLGSIAYRQGRTGRAVEHYENAITVFGSLGDTAHVGMLLAAVGRLKIGSETTEAVSRLRAALTQLPGDTFVKTALAHALWHAGRAQAAIAILDDALSQNGATPEAIRLRGEMLADLNRAEPALRDLDRVNYGDRPSSRAAWFLAKKTCEGVEVSGAGELGLVDGADDSGPVLLRVARVLRLEGDADTAAGLAERAVKARQPPLPKHLRKEAERLMAR
jgi:tetratricopeptide (TPR) repeat protein